ncbi:MAG: hypothetical protein Sylvanvirus1_14 [Sylvanvirus sp.]|uniref:Uncharacterized protein n=1 Tax=Sylvanvirus sp. TaxID=2487774 RepID=A0A3G5AH11_9VIRU|nr:MAG: hypothetical protein Sylvanvirus1_14 [Sylvanvirus sp.]
MNISPLNELPLNDPPLNDVNGHPPVQAAACISLIPGYIFHSAIGDPYLYRVALNGESTLQCAEPSYATLKPLPLFICYFRSLCKWMLRLLDDPSEHTQTRSRLTTPSSSMRAASSFRLLLQHAIESKGEIEEVWRLTNIMYLCLLCWNPVIREFHTFDHMGPLSHLLQYNSDVLYPGNLMDHWNTILESLRRRSDDLSIDICSDWSPSLRHAKLYFSTTLRDLSVSIQQDGQLQVKFDAPKHSFISDWISRLIKGSWITHSYVIQLWNQLQPHGQVQAQWIEHWLCQSMHWAPPLCELLNPLKDYEVVHDENTWTSCHTMRLSSFEARTLLTIVDSYHRK